MKLKIEQKDAMLEHTGAALLLQISLQTLFLTTPGFDDHSVQSCTNIFLKLILKHWLMINVKKTMKANCNEMAS